MCVCVRMCVYVCVGEWLFCIVFIYKLWSSKVSLLPCTGVHKYMSVVSIMYVCDCAVPVMCTCECIVSCPVRYVCVHVYKGITSSKKYHFFLHKFT